ncbi:TPA: restriction endonuclease subunit S [Bacillus thuringiensis]
MNASQVLRNKLNNPIGLINKLFFTKFNNSTIVTLENFIFEIKTGKTPPKKSDKYFKDSDIDWFKPGDIGFDIYLEEANDKLSNEAVVDKKATIFKEGTLLVTCIGDIARVGVLKKTASSNQQITGVFFNEELIPEFAYYIFLSEKENLEKQSSATTIPIINQSHLKSLKVGVPAINIQKEYLRFMEYCETCLSEEIIPADKDFNIPVMLIEKAQLIFKAYYKTKRLSAINELDSMLLIKLRKQIFHDAIQGKLVQQDENDEPASVLLERIKAEKEQLIREKKIKKEKPLPNITEEEKSFELPKGWEWVRLGDISEKVTDGTHKTPTYLLQGVKFISAKDVKNGKISFNDCKYVSEEEYNSIQNRCNIRQGTILITKSGSIGDVAVVDEQCERFCIFESVAVVNKLLNLNPYYMSYALTIILKMLPKKHIKGVGVKHLHLKEIKEILFPLPPLNEQQRIVEKLNLLMNYCDNLERNIVEIKQEKEKLMKAVLQEDFTVKEEVLN